MSWLKELSRNRFPKQDVTFLFDIDPSLALQRIQHRDELIAFEKVSFLKKVRKNYLKLAKENQSVIIDATKPINELVNQCIDIILEQGQ